MPLKLTEVKSSKEKRKTVKANKWGYGYVLTVSLLTVAASLFSNAYLVSAKGKELIEPNYSFRETIRATRRAKTLATYARKRGPMIEAQVDGYWALSAPGVGHIEDAIGGLISGPLGLWKNDEIYVYQYQKGDAVELTLENMKESKIHWNNGNPDPCEDRQVYIGAQRVPQQTDTKFIELIIGFLNFDCSATKQTGYVTILKSLTHGGPLMGRVYKASSTFPLEAFPTNVTSSTATPTVQLTEIGSILEDRGISSTNHLQTLLGIFFIPVFLWLAIFIRLSGVKVVLSMAIGAGRDVRSSAASNVSGASTSSAANDAESEVNASRKEVLLDKYINPRIIRLWCLPALHVFYAALYVVIALARRDDEGLIRTFINAFDTLHIDYWLHALALCSQELTAWTLSAYSSLHSNKAGWDVKQRALIYTYQYSTMQLRILKIFNISMCVCLILKALDVFPDELGTSLVVLLAVAIVVCELTMVLIGQSRHPFGSSSACTIGGLSDGFSVVTRQITNYLASQEVQGISEFDRKENSVPGMEYIGTLGDALALARPDYVVEGLINGAVIQVAVIEQSRGDNINFVKLSCVGNHQYVLMRHWIHQGKQGLAMV